MEEKPHIIIIGRAFGAGGRAIGKNVAKRLQIPYYDNELLQEAAVKFGFSTDVFARADEKRPSLFKRLLCQSYGVQETFNPDALSNETLYQAQSRVIRAVADKGSCVIVGRTADYILRDYPALISIFLHAPIDHRAGNILARGDAKSLEEARELALRRDKEREAYYNYFTGRRWGNAGNYSLSLDSSKFTLDKISDIIISLISKE